MENGPPAAMTNHYRTLGVDVGAEPVVIRSAYLALIRRYHPDRGGAEADHARAQAITAAWEVLRDPERRAAYDLSRKAQLQPAGAGSGYAAAETARVRGGTAGRNLFLLLAAGTLGLGWWAANNPISNPAERSPAAAVRKIVTPLPEPDAAPPVDREMLARAEAELAAAPPLPRAPAPAEIDSPVVLPDLPAPRVAPLPIRREAPRLAERQSGPRTLPGPASERPQVTTAEPAAETVDLAPLERHLQLLTDQSLRYGNARERNRLFATRENFLRSLAACADDRCRRSAYLRRNQEVAEIMRD